MLESESNQEQITSWCDQEPREHGEKYWSHYGYEQNLPPPLKKRKTEYDRNSSQTNENIT